VIIKRTTIAKKDDSTGLFVKVIETTDGIYLSRKIAINNTFYNCEKKRVLFQKPLLNSPMQTSHIHYDKYSTKWRIDTQTESLEDATSHAESNKRLFIPYLQMTKDLWEELDWSTAEAMFLKIARKGSGIVPYPIPLNASISEWKDRKNTALQHLNKSQELIPVMCVLHDIDKFNPIIVNEFKENKLLGIHYFDIKNPITQANLNALYEHTYNTQEGVEVPLVIGFCPHRHMEHFAHSSSVYALSIYGIDVVSYYVLKPEQMKYITASGPEKYPYYDYNEGGYNDSNIQTIWYGKDLTRDILVNISTEEGLDPWQANAWADYLKESEDLELLNSSILKGESKKFIQTKSRWHTALITAFPYKNL
jgi:hypothetical protein